VTRWWRRITSAAEKPLASDAGEMSYRCWRMSAGHDWIGSRTAMKACGAESCPPSGGETTTSTRNALNRYTATSNPVESLTYDFDGNLTADGTFAYAWDAEHRLATVTPASAPVGGPRSSGAAPAPLPAGACRSS